MKQTTLAFVFLIFALGFGWRTSAFACDPTTDPTCATATPSAIATETATLAATPSITATIANTATPTNTTTPTPSATSTPSLTPSPTNTPSPTGTATPTFSPTATATSTATPSLTPTMRPTTVLEAQSLQCLLPDGNQPSNALGIANQCTIIPVQVRAVKTVPAPAPPPAAKVNVAPTVGPKGDSPAAAMSVTGDWVTLAPGGVHWYRIDNGRNFFLDLFMDTNGKSDITLSLFSPEQANALAVDLPPKGRGAPVKSDNSHDLFWKGSSATGIWHALVRNYNPVPVQYRLGMVQSTTDRNCVSYWETLPTGEYVYWTDCGHYTDTSKK